MLLAPNLAIAARNLSVDRDELVLWVAIHEITHAVQFTGAPWLRGHIGGMLQELIDGLQVSLAGKRRRPTATARGWLASGSKLPDPAELREIAERARSGELLRLTLGEDRWALVERMQAAMSLIEGHAEHTMDAIGAEVLPSLPRLRAAMTRRRESRGLPWRVLERLLGLEMKMRQYEVGRRFCDAVVAAGRPGGAGACLERTRAAAERRGAEASGALAAAHGRPSRRLDRLAQLRPKRAQQHPNTTRTSPPRRSRLGASTGLFPSLSGRTHVPPVTSSAAITPGQHGVFGP